MKPTNNSACANSVPASNLSDFFNISMCETKFFSQTAFVNFPMKLTNDLPYHSNHGSFRPGRLGKILGGLKGFWEGLKTFGKDWKAYGKARKAFGWPSETLNGPRDHQWPFRPSMAL
jgi:hypothetical protein